MAEDIVEREQAAKEFYERETGMKLIAWCVETKFFWMGKASAAAEITALRKERDELREWALNKAETHHRLARDNEGLRAEHIASSSAYRNLADEIAALGERTGRWIS